MTKAHGGKNPTTRKYHNLVPETARVGVQIGKVTSGVLQHSTPTKGSGVLPRNGLQSSAATSNAIRGAEQSGNIAKQWFARTRWVRGLVQQHGRHEKQVVGIVA